jgi:hypothetical protein
VTYPKQSGGGYIPNWNSPPGDVNPPIIFEPPAALLAGELEIWVALSGGVNWGGAQVWISSDGNSYALIGNVNSSATQGASTADLPAHSAPDLTNTLSVDLTQSQGQLASVSATDAANFVTLCYLGGELLAYQNATLTAPGKYALTTLYRGAYGSTINDHPAGTRFARLDGAIGRFAYPRNLIGQTIYLKFASTNIVGGALQSLDSLPVYTYLLKGTGQVASIVLSGSFSGRPTANLVLQSYVSTASVTIPAGLSGSRGTAGIAATTIATFSIQKNGADIGTMAFAPSATTATFTMNSAILLTAGDVLTVVAPATLDATLADLAWTIMGITE